MSKKIESCNRYECESYCESQKNRCFDYKDINQCDYYNEHKKPSSSGAGDYSTASWVSVENFLPDHENDVIFKMDKDGYEIGKVKNGNIILRSIWMTKPTEWKEIEAD